MEQKHYYAFISHSTNDQKIALWLRKKLVNYNIPVSVQKEYNSPKRIRPIFVYQTDLAGTILKDALKKELNDSQYLIVICSPSSAQSDYVNDEVSHFIKIGQADKIIPFIVDGKPHSDNPDEECFPPALLKLAEDGLELRGINFRKQAKQLGSKKGPVVNLIASMLGVRFDTLWDWHKRKTRRNRTLVAISTLFSLLLATAITFYLNHLKNERIKSQIISTCELASRLVEQGDSDLANRLLLSVLDLKTSDEQCLNKLHFMLRKASQSRTVSWKTNDGYTSSAIFSPDGNYIISSAHDGSVCISNAITHETVGTLYHQDSIFLKDIVNYATFSPDMRYILSASDNKKLRLWDSKTLKEAHTFQGIESDVLAAKFSHDQTLIASGSRDGVIKIWETDSFNELKTLPGHHKAINSLVFSQDDQFLISGSDDSTIIVWDAHTFKEIRTIHGANTEVDGVAISPDNKLIASNGLDATLLIWETATGKCLSTITVWDGLVYSLDFSPNGQQLVCSILSVGKDRVAIYDVNSCRLIRQLTFSTEGFLTVSYSPDGNTIAIAVSDNSGRVILWDINDGFEFKPLIGHKDNIYSAYFSHDGRYIVSASQDSTVRIWDANTFKEVQRLKKFNKPVASAVFSPNDSDILTLTIDFEPQMWNVWNGMEIPNYADNLFAWSNAASQDGTYVLDPIGRLYNTKTKENKMLDPNGLYSASISHNGEMIVATTLESNGHDLILYDNSGTIITKVTQAESIINIAFSHDDRFIATTSFEGTVKVWDLSVMKETASYKISQLPSVCAVEFSPDDSKIIYSNDSVLELIDFQPIQSIINQTRERFKDRPLTDKERKMYYLE